MQQRIKRIHANGALLLAFLLSLSAVQAQDISGSWQGRLDVQIQKIPLVFHFEQEAGQWKGTMDSPSQGALGLPVSELAVTTSHLAFAIPAAGIRYEGKIEGDSLIQGSFHQGGMQFALDLRRKKGQNEESTLKRPQEPMPPYPYASKEITFANNEAEIRLAGTLTLPEGQGPWPAAILLAGSGPNDRDQHIFGHKTLKVIADYLTRQGIATLRYDKRGVGESEGDYAAATSADFAADALAAWEYVQTYPGIDARQIGLVGHSEGGMLAPMAANLQPGIAFLALLAAPGIPIDSLMLIQSYEIGKSAGMDEETLAQARETNREIYQFIKETTDSSTLRSKLEQLLHRLANEGRIPAGQAEAMADQLTSPWFRFFISYDPEPALSAIKVPVFAINGDKDLQVTAKENLEGIAAALEKAGHTNATIKTLPGLNHLLQESKTGAMSEYATIEQTISPGVLRELAGWIIKVTTQ